MHRESDRRKLFNRRTAILAGGKALLLSALAGRMYYLQVVESDRYATLAEENRINLRLLPPPRGPIVDRFGAPLAVNRQNYRVVMVSEQADDIEGTIDALGRIIEIGETEHRRILREVRRKRGFVPVTLRENLNWEEVARIEVNAPDLPGVSIDVGQSRHYPHGDALAHVLGYVAAVSENEATGDPLLELPGFRIGKAGVEKVYDLALRGKGGSSQVEVNALGRVIRELSRQEGQPGAQVTLTLDLELQQAVNERIGDESASVVVLDVHSGEVLAMSSRPSYDPNAFNKGLSTDDWKALVSNPKAPLINKSVAGQYSPGSTFKMLVALAALDKGAITRDTTVYCPGHMRLGRARFHCWKHGGHGRLSVVDAITQSCDVFFYEAAKRTGIDHIAAMAKRFGIGEVVGLDLPGERAGLMPTKSWKRGALDQPWHLGETLIVGIGQGYVLTTPLQLAVMTARIANGGRNIIPHLTRDVSGDAQAAAAAPAEADSLGVKPEHLALVRDGMNQVVNGKRGTARRVAINEPGMALAGKTGTVQVRRISKAEREKGVRKNEDLPWKERDHALFVGYAPVEAPRYAVAVVVEHGGSGSKAAAPIASDVLYEVQRRGALNPDRGRPVSEQGPARRGQDPEGSA
ncbi:MAG: penicillin-binding protein 2 [Hyphomicrobiales bacterium]|nr:penicillin-binding protein 2 [Hyphomicrobiales bacterium]